MNLKKQKAINEEKILKTMKRLCEKAKRLETEERKIGFHFGTDRLEKEIGKIRGKLINLSEILARSKTIEVNINLLTFEIKEMNLLKNSDDL